MATRGNGGARKGGSLALKRRVQVRERKGGCPANSSGVRVSRAASLVPVRVSRATRCVPSPPRYCIFINCHQYFLN